MLKTSIEGKKKYNDILTYEEFVYGGAGYSEEYLEKKRIEFLGKINNLKEALIEVGEL